MNIDFSNALLKKKVRVTCATITPYAQLMQMLKYSNDTTTKILNGTVLRKTFVISKIPRLLFPEWTKPIVIIERHAFRRPVAVLLTKNNES